MKRIKIIFIAIGIALMIPGIYLIIAYVLMDFSIGSGRSLASFIMWLAGAITLLVSSGIMNE